jgi:tetratricopeptide (TPR) repeat protein
LKSATLNFVRTAFTSLLLITLVALLPAQTKPAVSNFQSLAAKADAARDANQLEEAAALYRKALAHRPRWAEGWWSLGTIAYDRNQYAEAARAFEKVIALAPGNGTAHVMLGLSEFELGHDALAQLHIEKGISLGLDQDPDLRRVTFYHEGVLQQRQAKFQEAKETLQQLCLQGVESDAVKNTLGMVFLRMKSKTLPPAGSADAEIIARVGQAGCLAGQKKYDEARPDFTALVAQYPEYPSLHYAFGLFLLDANDLDVAEIQFKQEIENNPGDVAARLQIAASKYKIDSTGGIPFAQEAVKLAPQQPFAHFLLGLLLLDTDDYQHAIPELEIARKSFPQEARIYFALAGAYSRAGRKQEATEARATFARLNAQKEKSGGTETEAEPAIPNRDRIPVRDMPTPQ